VADITVIDPDLKKKVVAKDFYSKGKNSPVDGKTYQGWPVMTIVDGKIVMEDGKVKEGR
jgi:dihydroorotase